MLPAQHWPSGCPRSTGRSTQQWFGLQSTRSISQAGQAGHPASNQTSGQAGGRAGRWADRQADHQLRRPAPCAIAPEADFHTTPPGQGGQRAAMHGATGHLDPIERSLGEWLLGANTDVSIASAIGEGKKDGQLVVMWTYPGPCRKSSSQFWGQKDAKRCTLRLVHADLHEHLLFRAKLGWATCAPVRRQAAGGS